jgi:hypothetical protein
MLVVVGVVAFRDAGVAVAWCGCSVSLALFGFGCSTLASDEQMDRNDRMRECVEREVELSEPDVNGVSANDALATARSLPTTGPLTYVGEIEQTELTVTFEPVAERALSRECDGPDTEDKFDTLEIPVELRVSSSDGAFEEATFGTLRATNDDEGLWTLNLTSISIALADLEGTWTLPAHLDPDGLTDATLEISWLWDVGSGNTRGHIDAKATIADFECPASGWCDDEIRLDVGSFRLER